LLLALARARSNIHLFARHIHIYLLQILTRSRHSSRVASNPHVRG
jgi:hypothetical protein